MGDIRLGQTVVLFSVSETGRKQCDEHTQQLEEREVEFFHTFLDSANCIDREKLRWVAARAALAGGNQQRCDPLRKHFQML